ncbi:MAG: hypothetical protein QG623_623 [Patescibacteria group bacterium]|nr:hypothetical protein [Patescibacteria group bacterium]
MADKKAVQNLKKKMGKEPNKTRPDSKAPVIKSVRGGSVSGDYGQNRGSARRFDTTKITTFLKDLPSSVTYKLKRKSASRKIPGSPKSFKLEKRQKRPKVEKTSKIIADSFRFLGEHWKTFAIIMFFYIASYFVLAYATPNIDLPALIKEAKEAGSQPGNLDKLKVMTGALFTYRSGATDFARWAQFFLAIIFSLVFIYAIRNLHKDIKLRARDALYDGTGNLIPFFLNISLVAVQLIPLTAVAVIYNIGTSRELFIGNLEKFTALGTLIGSALLTLYFIPTALISLYAITLPGVYPMKTMQAVRIMVSQRRLEVVRNLLIFILFIFASYIVVLLLLVTYLPRFANLSLDLFFLVALPLIHVMMYKLYLRLLDAAKERINT